MHHMLFTTANIMYITSLSHHSVNTRAHVLYKVQCIKFHSLKSVDCRLQSTEFYFLTPINSSFLTPCYSSRSRINNSGRHSSVMCADCSHLFTHKICEWNSRQVLLSNDSDTEVTCLGYPELF